MNQDNKTTIIKFTKTSRERIISNLLQARKAIISEYIEYQTLLNESKQVLQDLKNLEDDNH